MRVLLDECVPRRLKFQLPGHLVQTVVGMGWGGIKNGPLLRLAAANHDALLGNDYVVIEAVWSAAQLSWGR